MPSEYRPRLSVELTELQAKKLAHYIPWGLQKHIFSVIVDDLINIFDNGDPASILGALLAKVVKPSELLNTLSQTGKG